MYLAINIMGFIPIKYWTIFKCGRLGKMGNDGLCHWASSTMGYLVGLENF